jgi:hypothetical protein
MDNLSIRNHIHVDGYAYGVRPRIMGATPWEKRLAPSAGAYQPEPPRDAAATYVLGADEPSLALAAEPQHQATTPTFSPLRSHGCTARLPWWCPVRRGLSHASRHERTGWERPRPSG